MPRAKPIRVPEVVNVVDLRKGSRVPPLVHFTAAQWRRVTRDAQRVRSLDPRNPYLEYTPIPGGGGIVQADCGVPGPDEVCSVRPVFDRPPRPPRPPRGPGPDPVRNLPPEQHEIRWECTCRSPRRPRRRVPTPSCELVVERWPRLRIYCRSNHCSGNCRLVLTMNGRRTQLACNCV